MPKLVTNSPSSMRVFEPQRFERQRVAQQRWSRTTQGPFEGGPHRETGYNGGRGRGPPLTAKSRAGPERVSSLRDAFLVNFEFQR